MSGAATKAVEKTTLRASIATGAVVFLCVVHAVRFVRVSTLPRVINQLGELYLLRDPERPFDLLIWIASIGWLAVVVLFLWWAVGAHASAKLLGRRGRTSPNGGWVVAAYCIPILNLFRPYQDMATLAWLSDPRDLPSPPTREVNPTAGYREAAVREVRTPWSPPPTLIGLWWASYIALTFAGGFVRVLDPLRDGTDAAALAIHEAMAQDLASIVSGLLCVAVIRGITTCQRERARRLSLAAPPL
jgi:Domain of unknown function (DUF4328)